MTHCIMDEYNTLRHGCQYLIKLLISRSIWFGKKGEQGIIQANIPGGE